MTSFAVPKHRKVPNLCDPNFPHLFTSFRLTSLKTSLYKIPPGGHFARLAVC